MKYYIYLPNTHLSLYLDFLSFIKLRNLNRYEFIRDYLYPIFEYQSTREKLFQILHTIYNTIDKDLSIQRNILDSEYNIGTNDSNIQNKTYLLNDLQNNLRHMFNDFTTFYKNICLFDIYYLIIGFIDYIFQFTKDFIYESKISDYVLKFKTKCAICESDINVGLTLKELLKQNTLYILPRRELIKIQTELFNARYNVEVLKLLSYPQTFHYLRGQIKDIPLYLKNNKRKRITLNISIRYPSIYDSIVLNDSKTTECLIFPNFNSVSTYVSILSLITDNINIIKDFKRDASLSILQKLTQFYNKFPAEIFNEYIIPQFHIQYSKYIPVLFINQYDKNLLHLQSENIFKVSCNNKKCEYKNNIIAGVNIIQITENIISNIKHKFENKTLNETFSLNIKTEHNYNNFNQIIELPYETITQYKKYLDNYHEEYIRKLKKKYK